MKNKTTILRLQMVPFATRLFKLPFLLCHYFVNTAIPLFLSLSSAFCFSLLYRSLSLDQQHIFTFLTGIKREKKERERERKKEYLLPSEYDNE